MVFLILIFSCNDPDPKGTIFPAGGKETFFLADGQSKKFRLRAKKGQFLCGKVFQNGVDIMVFITDSSGETFRVDGYTACYGDEPFGMVVDQDGWVQIELKALKFAGNATLVIQPLRLAGEPEVAFDEAFRARAKAGDAKSISAGLRYYQQATKYWALAGETVLAAEMRAWQAYGLKAGGSDGEALTAMVEAVRKLRAEGDLPRATTVLIELGVLQRKLGFYEGAEQSYRDAIALSHLGMLPWLRGEAFRSLGVLKSEMGLLQQAMTAYHKAISTFDEIGEIERRATVLSNLGAVYTLTGAFDKAETVLEQALADQQSSGSGYRLGLTLSRKGRLQMLNNRFDEALQTLDKARQVLKRANRHQEANYTLNVSALTYRRMGDYAQAENLLRHAITEFDRQEQKNAAAVARANLALVLESAGMLEGALEEANSAWNILKLKSNPENKAVMLFLIARITEKMGDSARALELMVQAISFNEAMRTNAPWSDLGRTFTGVRGNYHDFYLDLLYKHFFKDPNLGTHLTGLAHVDRLKTRGLDQVKNNAATPYGVVLQKERHLEELEQKRHGARARGASETVLAELRSEIQNALEELDRLRAFGQDLPERETSLREKRFWNPQDRDWLDEDSALLVYKLGEPRSYLWLVQKAEVSLYPLASREKIRNVALPWTQLMRTPLQGPLAEQRNLLAGELGRMLLGSVSNKISGKRLLVVKDDILHRVSMAALISPETNAPLVASHEMVCLPSAAFGATLAARSVAKTPSVKLALFAAPEYGQAAEIGISLSQESLGRGRSGEELVLAAKAASMDVLPPLPGSKLEAEALGRFLPQTQMYLGGAATLDRFYALDKTAFNMFHFALHGLLHPFETRLSGLIFALVNEQGAAIPGFLRAGDVARMKIPADMVTLSACHTGRGEDAGGEGNWGLTQAFLQAGAHRVVAGLWRVDDWAAAEMMPHFYKTMVVDSCTAAAALRHAQNTLRNETPYADPSYWAGFELHGDWR